jgi:aspartyl-tRNA(Asn)/glutamyl-tRNA(Gln) amidotransferase subunit C
MALELDDVKRVARLARLARIAVTEDEARSALQQLGGIFSLIEQMQSVDVSRVEPMSHAQDITLRLREDEVTESNERDRLLAVAPEVDAGLYLVPKVIE